MKSPDEIKKGLECCGESQDCTQDNKPKCPYYEIDNCLTELLGDALALIQQLQHNNAQLAIDKAKLAAENAEKDVRIQHLESELDAMKDEIDRDCETCKNSEACQEDGYYCMYCENNESNKTPCCNCVYGCNWEWRGVPKEE